MTVGLTPCWQLRSSSWQEHVNASNIQKSTIQTSFFKKVKHSKTVNHSKTIQNSKPVQCSVAKQYSTTDPRRQKINDAVLAFIAGDLLPVSLVESNHFQALLQTLDSRYSLPSRRTFTGSHIRKRADEMNATLKLR